MSDEPIEFTVFGLPQPAGSKRAFVQGNRAIVVDDNAKSRPWKQEVTSTAKEVVGDTIPFPEGPVVLRMRFTMPRPKGHYGSGKNAGVLKDSAPHFHTSRPDALKLGRGTEDALTGILYRDDAQTQVIAWKVYGDIPCVWIRAERPPFATEQSFY